jgi:hypothetical protein
MRLTSRTTRGGISPVREPVPGNDWGGVDGHRPASRGCWHTWKRRPGIERRSGNVSHSLAARQGLSATEEKALDLLERLGS